MLVLVGKSASGKTEVARLLVKKYHMEKLITCTTRTMRVGEINDIDYHFLSLEEFKKKADNHEFIEYQQYNNNFYGSLKNEISDNKVIILEPQGIRNYLEAGIDIFSIYLDIDSDTRFKRMIKRGDGEAKAHERILNDDLAFPESLKDKVNLVLNYSNLSIEEMTDLIYQAYQSR